MRQILAKVDNCSQSGSTDNKYRLILGDRLQASLHDQIRQQDPVKTTSSAEASIAPKTSLSHWLPSTASFILGIGKQILDE